MNPEEFVKYVRTEHVERLVDEYEEIFLKTPLEEYSDPSMKIIAQLWQTSETEIQTALRNVLKLGAQNSIASFLGQLDNVSLPLGQEKELILREDNGEILSGDLLDIFWEQEEEEFIESSGET
jgi:hypothetical protein